MLLRCTSNDVRTGASDSALASELADNFGPDTHHLDLRIGAEYVVYAGEIKRGWLRFFVADELYTITRCPMAYYATFFEVVDSRTSSCWSLGYHDTERTPEVLLTFEEWAKDLAFYERLVDGAQLEQRIFCARKAFMDEEFKSPP